jgi:hypothetical protein
MESLPLKMKFSDSIKFVVKDAWLPVLVGIGLAAYMDSLNMEIILTLFIPGISILLIGTGFLIGAASYVTITKEGVNDRVPFSKDMSLSWNDDIEVTLSKRGWVIISSKQHKHEIYICSKIFTYPEVSGWIKTHSPPNHKLRSFLPSDS